MQQHTQFIQLGAILVPNNSHYQKLAEGRLREQYKKEHEVSEKRFLAELKKFGKHNIVFTREPLYYKRGNKVYDEGNGIKAWDLETSSHIGVIIDPLWSDAFNEKVLYKYGMQSVDVGKHFLISIFKNHPVAKEIYENAKKGIYSMGYVNVRGARGLLESCVEKLPFLV